MLLFLMSALLALSQSPSAALAEAEPAAPMTTPTPQAKALNPDISANFLGLLQRGPRLSNDRTQAPRNGFSFQESELQFTADVDPYLRAVALFSISQAPGSTEYGISPEEVYVDTLTLPALTLKAGKFKLALGRHNLLHTHAFPFLDAPLIHQRLLGEEGLNEVGLSAAFLLPLGWFSELTLQGFSLSNEALYNSPQSGDVGALAHFKNLWDLTDDLTLELGFSGSAGKNAYERTTTVLGGDLTLKWRPAVGGKYRALAWSTEYLSGDRRGSIDEKLGGLASWLQYQFAERWWVQARYDYAGLPHSPSLGSDSRESLLIGFFPSEFSGLRLQLDQRKIRGTDRTDPTIGFQYNISIGAHPAHAY